MQLMRISFFVIMSSLISCGSMHAAAAAQQKIIRITSVVEAGEASEKGEVRPTMEDASLFKPELGLFGVFDGHGGHEFAHYARDAFVATFNQAGRDLAKTFDELENKARGKIDLERSGTTAVVAYVKWPSQRVIVANTGDSRAILIRNGVVIKATRDHKIEDLLERARIKKAGILIEKEIAVEDEDGTYKVERVPEGGQSKLKGMAYKDIHEPERIAGLSMSRSLGDFDKKDMLKTCQRLQKKQHELPALIHNPDIYEWEYKSGDVLLLACDGLWDVMSSEDVAKIVNNLIRGGFQQQQIITFLVLRAINTLKSSDNVSVIAVKFGEKIIELKRPLSKKVFVDQGSGLKTLSRVKPGSIRMRMKRLEEQPQESEYLKKLWNLGIKQALPVAVEKAD